MLVHGILALSIHFLLLLLGFPLGSDDSEEFVALRLGLLSHAEVLVSELLDTGDLEFGNDCLALLSILDFL